jgi:hypothetical protein
MVDNELLAFDLFGKQGVLADWTMVALYTSFSLCIRARCLTIVAW